MLEQIAEQVRVLASRLTQLEAVARPLQLPALAQRDWYEVLSRKLLPQLADEPYLVVAVVGGTNTGKSMVFNHLAGSRISATSPLASQTKHPTCLVPSSFANRHRLADVFPGFELLPWQVAGDPLTESSRHMLFWKTDPALVENLLLLDTPDIDSDARINWERADAIRQAADVLIAVLTQQNYNDAAVKQFFRKAAEDDKPVIVLFNQCLLPEDELYWPKWLETFASGTGLDPQLVYLAPNDRAAADSNRLPFYRRIPRKNAAAETSAETSDSAGPQNPEPLSRALSELHFDTIKLRTLNGALQHLLSPGTGAPSYLSEIRKEAGSYAQALKLLSAQELAHLDRWPLPPNAPLIAEIRKWWSKHRTGWSRSVHDVYGKIGEVVTAPFRWWKSGGTVTDPMLAYREQEWDELVRVLELLIAELTRLTELGNPQLRPRLELLLRGDSRARLLQTLSAAHQACDLNGELEQTVAERMQTFQADSPHLFRMLKQLDQAAAVARPALSIGLFMVGIGPAGHALLPALGDVAAQSLIVHVAGEAIAGAGTVVAGEAAVSATAGTLRQVEASFRQIQALFIRRRIAWFAGLLHQHWLGPLHEELASAATVPDSQAFRDVEQTLATLEQQSRGSLSATS